MNGSAAKGLRFFFGGGGLTCGRCGRESCPGPPGPGTGPGAGPGAGLGPDAGPRPCPCPCPCRCGGCARRGYSKMVRLASTASKTNTD